MSEEEPWERHRRELEEEDLELEEAADPFVWGEEDDLNG